MNKRKHALLLSLISAFLLSACGDGAATSSGDSSSGEDAVSSSESEVDEGELIKELNDDPDAVGTPLEGENENRVPDDPLYDDLLEQKRVLDPGETYTEGFEEDVLQTKIFPSSAEEGAKFQIVDDASIAISGKSLLVESDGNYAAIHFSGMRFASSGRYTISFDYRCLDVPETAYFQFRSLTAGKESDVFVQFDGGNGEKRSKTFDVDLKSYSDYRLMVFPGVQGAKFVLDNIKLTRNNSRPQLRNAEVIGSPEVGATLTYRYDYFDAEGDAMVRVDRQWFAALDRQGLNRTHLAETSDALLVGPELRGWYIGVALTPYSNSAGEDSRGLETLIYTLLPIGGEEVDVGKQVTLDYGESFVEDFEFENDPRGSLYFTPQEGSSAYVTSIPGETISGMGSLRLVSPGSYNATYFSGIRFAPGGIYRISFSYRFASMGETVYVQARSLNGGYSHDKYAQIDESKVLIGEQGLFETVFTLDRIDDYALMIFPSQTGYDFVLDDLRIERLAGESLEVADVLLGIGEEVHETFDSPYKMKIGIDNAEIPASKVLVDSAQALRGDGSLYFESPGSYRNLMIPKGVKYQDGATYRVTFSYKILSFVDTMYVQFFGTPPVFAQFGSSQEVGQEKTFMHDFLISKAEGCLIQFFPGGGIGTTSLLIDDLIIHRLA